MADIQRVTEHNVMRVCDAIADIEHFTTVDAFNILFALSLRHARTPFQQQGRQDVDKALSVCRYELADIWTRDKQ